MVKNDFQDQNAHIWPLTSLWPWFEISDVASTLVQFVISQRTFLAWMPSINKKCHQNEFLSIVQIMPGWLLASVAVQAGFCLSWSQTPMAGFLVMRLTCFKEKSNVFDVPDFFEIFPSLIWHSGINAPCHEKTFMPYANNLDSILTDKRNATTKIKVVLFKQ